MQVTRAVNELPGIQETSFSYQAKEVTVTFDPARITEDQIREVVQRVNAEIIRPDEATGPAADVIL